MNDHIIDPSSIREHSRKTIVHPFPFHVNETFSLLKFLYLSKITLNMKRKEAGFLERITIEPLTKANWGKFVQLFGEKGACGNCWCMYYRLTKAEFKEGQSGGNREAMQELVVEGKPTGILGFYEGEPIAWCAFAPREHYSRIERSRVHKRIDDLAVWSIPCFFVDKKFRGYGVTVEMLKAVIRYARDNGIKVLEAYPTIPTKPRFPDSFVWMGLYQSFEKAGFEIADHKSKNRPLVRYYTEKSAL
jgi:GNAT superfamily N-acetyltransferase